MRTRAVTAYCLSVQMIRLSAWIISIILDDQINILDYQFIILDDQIIDSRMGKERLVLHLYNVRLSALMLPV